MPDSVVAPVTRQESWEVLGVGLSTLFTDTSALSDASAYVHRKASTFWQTQSASPGQFVAFDGTDLESNSLSLSFFGEDGGGTAPYHAIGALWVGSKLVSGQDTEFRGTFISL